MLLIDFDGVLNPYAAAQCPAGFIEYDLDMFPGEDPVRLNREHARWLGDLVPLFEMAWASACPQDLSWYCERLIGLRPMPKVPMPEPPFPGDAKVEAIDAFVGDRAVAWVDDALGERAHRWGRERRAPTMLVDIDPSIGLTRDHVVLLARWAQSLTA